MNKVTLITNIFNEEYLLPFWLKYHKNVFDHGIVIDWCSTDRSLQIIKQICPTWEIRSTKHIYQGKPLFETITADEEIMEIESTISGYKIFLNVTEWLLTTRNIRDLLDFNTVDKCYPIHVLSPIKTLPNYTPTSTKEFIACFRNKLTSVYHKRKFRFIFNRSNGNYIPGRHLTNDPNDTKHVDLINYNPVMNGLMIVWCGYFPLTEQMFQRKLSVSKHMCKKTELDRGFCYQHFWEKNEMNKDYNELCYSNKPILNNAFINLCIDHAILITDK